MDTLNKSCSKKQNGFTLIELMVVLSIVSVLAIGSVTLFKEQKVNIDQDLAEAKLETVKVALLRFIERNNYLPCPDTNTKGEANFGLENRVLNQTGYTAAIPSIQNRPAQAATDARPFIPAIFGVPAQPARVVNVDKCAVNSGTVPFRAIELSQADVTDTKHNLFHYAVTQGVSDANKIANCPQNSACFFNRNTTPAFDSTTEPVSGSLGVDNLELCAGTGCSGVDLLGRGIVAIVLAYNERATNNQSVEEAENQDGDTVFIQQRALTESFDDLSVSIFGHEIKRNQELELQEGRSASEGNQTFSGEDVLNLGEDSSRVMGMMMMGGTVIWDRVSQAFDFGQRAANQEVVLTYQYKATGSWDYSTMMGGSSSDIATVSNNGTEVDDYTFDNSGRRGGRWGSSNTVWEDSVELVLQTDSEGLINLEFAADTAQTTTVIDFTNIELVFYATPPAVPNFPSVEPISGITQTEGL